MASSTWTWLGVTSNPGLSSNWTLTSGPGNASGIPQPGDTAIITGTGVPPLFSDTTLSSATIDLTGSGTIQFSNDTTSGSNSGISSASVIDAEGPATVLDIAGPFVNSGLIEVTGAGDSLAISVTSGAAAAGVLTNQGQIVVDGGSTLSVAGSVNGSGTIAISGTATVQSGGSIVSGTVFNGGSLVVDSGGSAQNSIISSGGVEVVSSGGTAVSTVVAGGTLELLSGSHNSGSTISSGGTIEFFGTVTQSGGNTPLSGATVDIGSGYVTRSGTTVGNGVKLNVWTGGTAFDTFVSSGGTETVSSGGTASNTTVNSSGAFDILSGGYAEGTTISSGGTETVSPGGVDTGAVIAGGMQIDNGTATAVTVSSGGVEVVGNGAVANGITVSSGGEVEFFGSAHIGAGTTFLPGALGVIGSGFTLSGYTVSSGGTLVVASSGTISNTTLLSGATLELLGGAQVSGSLTLNAGATEVIGSGYTQSGGGVSSGVSEFISSGAIGEDITVSNGGVLEFLPGSQFETNTVLSGGKIVFSGSVSGIGAGNTYGSGASVFILPGATTRSGVTFGNGVTLVISSGGTAQTPTIGSGATEIVSSGGTTSNTTVNSGGTLYVFGGATVVGPIGGTGTVEIGIVTSNTLVNSSNSPFVVSGLNLDIGDTIASGGTEDVFGATRSATVDGSGTLVVSSGGFASSTILSSGGTETVYGSDTSATVNSGGQMVVASGGKAVGTQLTGGTTGFFNLVVSSGGAAVSASISSGGHEIVSGGSDSNTVVHSGGSLTVEAGSSVSATVSAGGSATVESGGTISAASIHGGTLDLQNGASTGASLSFAGSGGVLDIDGTTSASMPTATISGFVVGHTIDLTGIAFSSSGGATLTSGTSSDVLQVTEGGTTYDLNFNSNQNFLSESFTLGPDGATGTDITLTSATAPAPQIYVTIDGGAASSGNILQTGGHALASSYTGFLAFGDSNIDTGYFFNNPISNNPTQEALYQQAWAAGGGLPTTIPTSGPIADAMNSALLAADIEQSATSISEGGTNYAASGATITGSLNNSLAPSVVSQISSYLASVGGVASSTALYLFAGGGNDAKEAEALYPSENATDVQNQINYMIREANALAGAIEQLYSAGGRYFLIDDHTGDGVLGTTFNNTLWADLASANGGAGIPFLVADDNGVVAAITQNTAAADAAFGTDITNTTKPPAGPFEQTGNTNDAAYSPSNGGAVVDPDPGLVKEGWSLYGTPADQQPNAATQYLWADDQHLAGAGQLAEAEYMYNEIQTAVPTVSQTLAANVNLTTGLTTGTEVSSGATFQWQEETPGGTWQNISGATGETYTIQTSDVGKLLRVEAFDGGASAFSAATEAVVPCFCHGTLIQTKRGQKRVEALEIGDEVTTLSGAARPIKWIGRRSYDGRFILGRSDILPICIKAGAFDDEVPRRDLWVSPLHAMYLDGILIEARDLINGGSIVQASRVEKVEYFHIELDSHDVIFAEGAPSETYVDDDSRGMFHNADEYYRLYPADGADRAQYCAPRVVQGYEIEAVRRRIALRAGLLRPADLSLIGPLHGHVDEIGPNRITGWAQTATCKEVPVCLEVHVNGGKAGEVLANRYREDLKQTGLGSGYHRFIFKPPAGLITADSVVEVRRCLDGAKLSVSAQTQIKLRA